MEAREERTAYARCAKLGVTGLLGIPQTVCAYNAARRWPDGGIVQRFNSLNHERVCPARAHAERLCTETE